MKKLISLLSIGAVLLAVTAPVSLQAGNRGTVPVTPPQPTPTPVVSSI